MWRPLLKDCLAEKEPSLEEALVFPTTHHMLTSEALLKREGFKLRLVPAPPGAGQVCSTAIAVSSADTPGWSNCLRAKGYR